MRKKNVALIFGGKSTEHEISIKSARNIAAAIDTNQYDLMLIGICKSGKWFLKTNDELQTESSVLENQRPISLQPGTQKLRINQDLLGPIDVAFPIVHGTNGEDGSLQGLLKIMDIPFVGPSVTSSALCIDKEVAKRLMNEAGIPNAPFLSYLRAERSQITFEKVVSKVGLPMYIKPPNLGSSVGISKVTSKKEFDTAIDYAFQYDQKVLIEQNINGREIECAILGNTIPKASPTGEVVTLGEEHKFYSYEAKYIDEAGSKTVIPADLTTEMQTKIQSIALKTYKTLCCEGMARVDVFVTNDQKIWVNEVNTLPGFTDISMYPKLWETAGIQYSELISTLISLALERANEEAQNQTYIES